MPELREYLKIVKSSADSLLALIDDILDFSKVEAGKLTLDPIDFNLRKSLDESVKMIAFRAREKGLRLICDVDPDVPAAVNADPVRLRQIILNLLGNAVKFTERGEVALHLSCDSRNGSVSRLHFVVRDTGVGIAPDKLRSIFEAFAQADSSTTRKFGGTGLGLAICHRLAELMGGSIWAESEPGRGADFHFTIQCGPAHPEFAEDDASPLNGAVAAQTLQEQEASKQEQEAPNFHLLVAEDNPSNRMIAHLILERAGFRVSEAANGREAVQAARETRFDAVLMDCRMPEMDGYAAAREIRLLPGPSGQIPIIALTASAFKQDREQAEAAGMDDFISKPFRSEELIAKCLGWAKANAGLSEAPRCGAGTNRSSRGNGQAQRYGPELLHSLAEIFLQTAPAVFHDLLNALLRQDWAEAKDWAHWLQGGGTAMLNPALQAELVRLERACAYAPSVVPVVNFDLLHAEFKNASQRAEQWLRETLVSHTTA